MYSLEISAHLDRHFRKLAKKDIIQHTAIEKKVLQILENPHRFKPLCAPMQNLRRVHVMGSFVLVFSIDESKKTVVLEDYDHHDKIYK